jgi:phosphoglycolate phosphatase
MNIDSIIFDLDGTLWSAINGILKSWKTVLSKYPNIKKEITAADLESCMGLQVKEIGNKLFPELDEDFQMKLLKEHFATEQIILSEQGGILYPNVEETLTELAKNYKLFIVSNCQAGYIPCFYRSHKLDKYFIDSECSGVTGLSKAENIKLIIKRNNLRNPIYVGDTALDASSSRSAGIPFVYASYGFGNVAEYDYVVEEFEELLTLVRESKN